ASVNVSRSVRAILTAASASVVSALPVFLVGTLAVQLTQELGIGLAGIGLAVAMFRLSSAAASIPLGQLADHIGATRALRIASAIAAAASLAMATLAVDLAVFLGCMVVAGTASALAQPGAN